MIVPFVTFCLFKLGLIPKTQPYIVRKFKLKELQQLPRDWENDDITTTNIISIMNSFSKACYETKLKSDDIVFTMRGMKYINDIFREYIGGDTGKDLLIISRRCIIDAFEKRFNLNEIKTIIENWKGENVAKVRTTLSRYTDELLSFTPEEENELKLTGFFSGVEDVIEGYLGKENFKTLEIMILFFEQMDQITNV
jgi:hypothetical protein